MNNYEKMEKIINEYNLSGENVLRILIDWHGTDIINDDFMENLSDCEVYSIR